MSAEMPDLKTVTFDASQWQPIETAPKEMELLGWREDCGPLLVMHTSFDRFASEHECDETDEETLFQKDWFGSAIPGGFERLEGSQTPTHWMPIPAAPGAAPTPAAQSAGQEATDAPSAIWTTEMLASVRKDAETLHSRLSCRPLAGDAAPVNGGAFRKRVCAALMIPEALDDDAVITTVELTDYEFRRLFSESVNGGERVTPHTADVEQALDTYERAADAQQVDDLAAVRAAGFHDVGALLSAYKRCADHVGQQSIETTRAALASPSKVGGDEREMFEAWVRNDALPFDGENAGDPCRRGQAGYAEDHVETAWVAWQAAMARARGWSEQHARDSAELRRLCAARDEARRTAEYWKANHIAGNAEIERLKKLLEAKVGRDEPLELSERHALDSACADIAAVHLALDLPEEDAGGVDAALEAIEELKRRAALSADGGEDKRDAERYRWLRQRYIGFDFDWMADNDGNNGKQVICFEMDSGMRIGVDINDAIDAAIAANQSGKGGE